jgi:hypothetical protein
MSRASDWEETVTEQRHNRGGILGSMNQARSYPKPPPAPGATESPQHPGQVPDRSTVPGFHAPRVPPAGGRVLRPLIEYGTAQALLRAFPGPDEEAEPEEFEQVTASFEELRKAYPWQVPPLEPTPFFALDQGVSPVPPALPGDGQVAELPTETKQA